MNLSNGMYIAFLINPIQTNIMTNNIYLVIINPFLWQIYMTIGPHQHQPWNNTVFNYIKQKHFTFCKKSSING